MACGAASSLCASPVRTRNQCEPALFVFSLIIAQVTSLEPRRWCTRCHVHSTADTVPYVLGQTTHDCVDRHNQMDVCICMQPRLLVGAAPRVQLRMKLGAQEVQAALRQTQQRFAGGFARARAVYVSLLRALNSLVWPRLSAEADEMFSKSRMDAWSVRISGQAALIGPGFSWGIPLAFVLCFRLQMRIVNWQLVWLSMWLSSAMWLFVYWQLWWSKIEHHVWQEEFRRWEEECKEESRRWRDGFEERVRSVWTPNLGWALEALEIDTLEGLTLREAQRAFHRLAKRYHPDVTGRAANAERFKDLNQAYDAIKQHLQSASATAFE